MWQGKAGWWIAGAAAVIILISVGYGMGHRQDPATGSQALTPAGAPLSSIQIEPIQPQQELASITANPPATTATETQSEPVLTTSSSAPQQMASAAPAGPSTPLPTEESARVREIQKALKSAGFDPGPADGRMGARTRTAIRDFQVANGLEPDGKVGPKTWSRLETYLASASAGSGTTSTSTSN